MEYHGNQLEKFKDLMCFVKALAEPQSAVDFAFFADAVDSTREMICEDPQKDPLWSVPMDFFVATDGTMMLSSDRRLLTAVDCANETDVS